MLVTAIVVAGVTWSTMRHAGVLALPGHALARPGDLKPTPVAPNNAVPRKPPSQPGARIGEIPDDLVARRLTIPVSGVKTADLRPSFFDIRGLHAHEAIDIMAPRGQPVVAVEDGTVAKLFTSVPGGLTIYQFDPTGTYAYYYAHLDRYADGLVQGGRIKRGQIIAYVGSTGDADAAHPHLHFTIFRLGPEKQWWKGEALDPFPALTRR